MPVRRWLTPWLVIAVACAAWVAGYVIQEDPAYLSDFQYYWKLYWTYGEQFQRNPLDWLSDVALAVHNSEHNPLFTVALLPFNLAWGRSRLGYIEGVACLYMLPAMAVAWHVTRRMLAQGGGRLSRPLDLALVGVPVLSVSFWIPTLRGYPDVLGLVPLGLATWYLWAVDFSHPQRWTTLFCVALCVYAPFLVRRWYIFAIVAEIVASSMMAAWRMARAKTTWPFWLRWIEQMAVVGALVLGCVFTLQGGMALHVLNFNYAEAYVAFQRTGAEHVQELLSRYGLLAPLLCLSGWWVSARQQRPIAAVFGYLWMCLLLTVALFTRVQGLGIHHHLPVGLFLVLMTGLSVCVWAEALGATTLRSHAFLLAVGAVLLFNFLHVFVPALQWPTVHMLTEQHFPPLKLAHLEVYRQLAEFIEREIPANQRVSVFASNTVLSQTMMENFLTDEGTTKLTPIAEVDEYEGFNLGPLYSDYLVVPNRPQVIDPAHQRVVVIPSDTLVQGRTIGAAYREVARYPLDDGLAFLVFRKVRPFRADELKAFLNELAAVPRPPGHGYTPMQLALLGTRATVQAGGSFRIDPVGGNEWAVHLAPQTDLTLELGFWLEDGVPHMSSHANSAASVGGDETVFSVRLPPDRVAYCQARPPRLHVSLDGHELLAKTFDTPVVDFFKLPRTDVPRLHLYLQGGGDPRCDRILIDHRTD